MSYNSAYDTSNQITASDGRKFGAPTIFSEVSGSSGCGSTCWYTTPTCASGWTATKPSSGYYISATSRSYANNGARTCYRTSDIKCSTYGYTYSSALDSAYFVCSATTISGTNGLVCYTCSHARCAISPVSSINTTYFTTASAKDNQGSLGTRYRCTGRTTNTEANQPNGTYFNYGTASCAYQGGNANPCATMYGYRCSGRTSGTESAAPNSTFFSGITSSSCSGVGTGWRCTGRNASDASACSTTYFTGQHSSTCSGITGYRGTGRTTGTYASAPNSTFFNYGSSYCSGVGNGYRCTSRNASDASQASSTYFTGQHSSSCTGITGYRCTGRASGTCSSAPDSNWFTYGSAYCSGVGNSYKTTGCASGKYNGGCPSNMVSTGSKSSGCGHTCHTCRYKTCSDLGYTTSKPGDCYYYSTTTAPNGDTCYYNIAIVASGATTSNPGSCYNYSSGKGTNGVMCYWGASLKTCPQLNSSWYQGSSSTYCSNKVWYNRSNKASTSCRSDCYYTTTAAAQCSNFGGIAGNAGHPCTSAGYKNTSTSYIASSSACGLTNCYTPGAEVACSCSEGGYSSSVPSCRKNCSATTYGGKSCYTSNCGSAKTCGDFGYSSSKSTGCYNSSYRYTSSTKYPGCSLTCYENGTSACSSGSTCSGGSCVSIIINGGAVATSGSRNNCGSYNKVGIKLQCGSNNWSGNVTIKYSCTSTNPQCNSDGNQTGVSWGYPSGSVSVTCYSSGQPVAVTALSADYQYLKCSFEITGGTPSGATVNHPAGIEAGYYYVRPTSCSDGGYVSSCPANQAGTKVDYGGLTCYKDCKDTCNRPTSCAQPTCSGTNDGATTFGSATGGRSVSQQAGDFLANCQSNCGVGSCIGGCNLGPNARDAMRCRCCKN